MQATIMKRFSVFAAIVVAGSTCCVPPRGAVAGTVVSPNAYENTEGRGESNPAWPLSAKAQSIFHRSEFTNMPTGGAMLTSMNLRPNGGGFTDGELGFERYVLAFGVTSVDPEDMSTVFEVNLLSASPTTVVYDDQWLVEIVNPDPPGRDTRPFDFRAELETPFFYNPEDGNLFVEWFFERPLITGEVRQFDLDYRSAAQTTIWAGNPADAAGCCGGFSVVTEFTFAAPGDFDGNDVLDANDIDRLSAAIREMSEEAVYDVNRDGNIDPLDHGSWVKDLKNTWFGDANLDGEFNSSDFVQVFQAGHYETGQAAVWSEGDWNGDGIFSSVDFVKAFLAGGYEQGQRDAINAVPEPTSMTITAISLFFLSIFTRRAQEL